MSDGLLLARGLPREHTTALAEFFLSCSDPSRSPDSGQVLDFARPRAAVSRSHEGREHGREEEGDRVERETLDRWLGHGWTVQGHGVHSEARERSVGEEEGGLLPV